MTFLLDVNVLIALLDPRHIFHARAHKWFADEGSADWATCPTTENGLIRIIGNPRYPNNAGPPALGAAMLSKLTALPGHHFWPDSISLLRSDFVDPSKLMKADQITDTYLLALALSCGGALATLDSRLSPAAAAASGSAGIFLVPEI